MRVMAYSRFVLPIVVVMRSIKYVFAVSMPPMKVLVFPISIAKIIWCSFFRRFKISNAEAAVLGE